MNEAKTSGGNVAVADHPLVDQLRGGPWGLHDPAIAALMREAADEIERLRRLCAELNAELVRYQTDESTP